MSTSAQITVHSGGEKRFAIDRTYDGYPANAGADLLRALYVQEKHSEEMAPKYGGRDPAHHVASRIVSAVEGDHNLCPLDQWRGYEYVYEVHAETGAVLVAERKSAGKWKDGPCKDGAAIYEPISADTDGYKKRDKRHELAGLVNEARERSNGNILRMNLEAGEQEWEYMPEVGPFGRDTDTRATPVVDDDVATWITPNGELAGRSLVAKEPRVTINGENEPNATEQAARNGTRALIDWHGRQAVTDDGTAFTLSDEQMQELAKAYKSARSRRRRAA